MQAESGQPRREHADTKLKFSVLNAALLIQCQREHVGGWVDGVKGGSKKSSPYFHSLLLFCTRITRAKGEDAETIKMFPLSIRVCTHLEFLSTAIALQAFSFGFAFLRLQKMQADFLSSLRTWSASCWIYVLLMNAATKDGTCFLYFVKFDSNRWWQFSQDFVTSKESVFSKFAMRKENPSFWSAKGRFIFYKSIGWVLYQ